MEIAVELPHLTVRALSWGPADGPLALLLHGFPDTAWSWRGVGPLLADAGWRVVAPFSRGYEPTGLAPDDNYEVAALVHDTFALHTALGADDRAMLVGHDWGAITAYGVAAVQPNRFGRIVAMSAVPAPTMQHILRTRRGAILGLRQLRHSWYLVANQIPGAAERAFVPLTRRLWADWSPGFDATEDLAHVADALPTRAHRTAALSYYRALARPWRRSPAYAAERHELMAVPRVATLYLHGDRDGCIIPEFAEQVGVSLAPGSRALMVPAAGHFVQLEQPQVVAEAILEFAG